MTSVSSPHLSNPKDMILLPCQGTPLLYFFTDVYPPAIVVAGTQIIALGGQGKGSRVKKNLKIIIIKYSNMNDSNTFDHADTNVSL